MFVHIHLSVNLRGRARSVSYLKKKRKKIEKKRIIIMSDSIHFSRRFVCVCHDFLLVFLYKNL